MWTSPLVDRCLLTSLPGTGAGFVSFRAAFRIRARMMVLLPPPVSPKKRNKARKLLFHGQLIFQRAGFVYQILQCWVNVEIWSGLLVGNTKPHAPYVILMRRNVIFCARLRIQQMAYPHIFIEVKRSSTWWKIIRRLMSNNLAPAVFVKRPPIAVGTYTQRRWRRFLSTMSAFLLDAQLFAGLRNTGLQVSKGQ